MSYFPQTPAAYQAKLNLMNYSTQGFDFLSRVMPCYLDTIITSAQILALNTTPIAILPAPGVGIVNVLCGCFIYLPYNSTTYSFSATLDVRYQNSSGGLAAQFTQAFCQSAATAYSYADPQVNMIALANQPLVAFAATGNPTTGNSPFNVRVWYQQIVATDIGFA